jgi:hypothetical protein
MLSERKRDFASSVSVDLRHFFPQVREDLFDPVCVDASVEGVASCILAQRKAPVQNARSPIRGRPLSNPETQLQVKLFDWANQAGASLQRLDQLNQGSAHGLDRAREALSAGDPIITDFPLSLGVAASFKNGVLPADPNVYYPRFGRHCVVIVGFSEELTNVVDPLSNKKINGAFRIRNNWGIRWGNNGYGWLPYAVARSGLLQDSWRVSR